MIPQIAGLTKKGIDDHIENLKYKIEVNLTWGELSKTEHGKFVKFQIEKELNFWKGQYSQIDAGSPAALNLLSFIQGIEAVLSRYVTQLVDNRLQAEQDEKELSDIVEFLKLDKNKKIGHTLLPTGYVKKGE